MSEKPITFEGNNTDLMAIIGAITAAMTLFSCGTMGFGFYCMPCIPGFFGLIGLLTAHEATDPQRTQLLSWISLGVTFLFVALIGMFILLYFLFIALAIAAGN
ncbi:hypothetical protein QUF58_04100 [Anaerolineales bacterium HSG24]|nr:hypothetical protein [Anaerolineales bacterium HSG24]